LSPPSQPQAEPRIIGRRTRANEKVPDGMAGEQRWQHWFAVEMEPGRIREAGKLPQEGATTEVGLRLVNIHTKSTLVRPFSLVSKPVLAVGGACSTSGVAIL
jgi:hypothetical protein